VYGVDFNAMYKVLDHIKAAGQLPEVYESWFQDNIMTIGEGQRRVQSNDAVNVKAQLESLQSRARNGKSLIYVYTANKVIKTGHPRGVPALP
jgi:hypothetical protein